MKPKKYRNRRNLDLSFAKFFNPEKSPHTTWNPITLVLEYMPKHQTQRMGKIFYESWRKNADGKKVPFVRGRLLRKKTNEDGKQ